MFQVRQETFLEETTYEDGIRVATYLPLTGIFETGDIITGADSGRTAEVFDVWGLLGARDRTLHHVSINKHETISYRC